MCQLVPSVSLSLKASMNSRYSYHCPSSHHYQSLPYSSCHCLTHFVIPNVHLGSAFTWNNDFSKDIQRIIQLATGAYGDLQPGPI